MIAGLAWCGPRQTAIVKVGDDTDNRFDASLPSGLPVVDVLPEWVFMGEVPTDKGLINECHVGCIGIVVFREVASAQ